MDGPADDAMARPELIALDPTARGRVQAQIAAKGGHCERCGAKDFDVGDALFLGFLFLDEDREAYMIALTCRNPGCAAPRTAIVLPEKDFLSDGCACGTKALWPSRAARR
ncbi:hypothetical protein H7H82_22125 [Mycobacterium heidelbergense]|uniref:Uncharacterized protein n=1 Tax=Mycobacterium heidelbergense TaxID=53376 RepID=A0A1X0DR22_MYCHE|nr:hypothetical protein [Mycobacterium heidelbergense]MCV7053253.1 hypothetical protein [Mycobacterium heidelbergense]ORA74350.1 hypothetical protein BST25_09915 [Mycobacterium heidelbergense]BBZ49047.1 hypothetical protein MHEI_07640 [Mycobacterium heidelbergense]